MQSNMPRRKSNRGLPVTEIEKHNEVTKISPNNRDCCKRVKHRIHRQLNYIYKVENTHGDRWVKRI